MPPRMHPRCRRGTAPVAPSLITGADSSKSHASATSRRSRPEGCHLLVGPALRQENANRGVLLADGELTIDSGASLERLSLPCPGLHVEGLRGLVAKVWARRSVPSASETRGTDVEPAGSTTITRAPRLAPPDARRGAMTSLSDSTIPRRRRGPPREASRTRGQDISPSRSCRTARYSPQAVPGSIESLDECLDADGGTCDGA